MDGTDQGTPGGSARTESAGAATSTPSVGVERGLALPASAAPATDAGGGTAIGKSVGPSPATDATGAATPSAVDDVRTGPSAPADDSPRAAAPVVLDEATVRQCAEDAALDGYERHREFHGAPQ